MTGDALTVDHEDGIATVALDDAENRNALDLSVADELVEAAATLGTDDDVRCIVLTHESDFFCTGANLGALSGDEADAPMIRQLAGRLHEAVIQFHQAPKPVIGGLDGVAAGAGFGMALFPDLLYVSDESRLEYAYPRIGLTGDGGSTFFLPRLVGLRAAKEIALLDEPIGPERAVELGLATEVVDSDSLDERVQEVAANTASGPTVAQGATTRLLTESFDRSLESQLAAETDEMAKAVQTDDYERGIAGFFGDEEPDFRGK